MANITSTEQKHMGSFFDVNEEEFEQWVSSDEGQAHIKKNASKFKEGKERDKRESLAFEHLLARPFTR